MAEGNVPAPTRTEDQLVPVRARLPIGKSNLLLDLQKKQKNPIFLIGIDILQNTNFFSAFTASANVPSIYVQQFWNTLTKDPKTGVYSFQLDELWFNLNAELLHSALGITPRDSAHPFVAPPTGDVVIDFATPLEEFTQAIKTFFSDAVNLKDPSKKPKPYVIPYCRFTKLIICYLGGKHNIHQRPQFPLHITIDDYTLGNLKFVPKGEKDEPYINQKTVMAEEGVKKKKSPLVAKSKKPSPAKKPTPAKKKSTKPIFSRKVRKGKEVKRLLKLVDEEDEEASVDEAEEEPQPTPEPPVDEDEYNLQKGIQMSLESLDAQGQGRQAPVGGVVIHKSNPVTTRTLPVIKGKGKGIATDEQVAQSLFELQQQKKKSITDQYDDTSANTVRDTPSPSDDETGATMEKATSEADTEVLRVEDEQGEEVSHTVALDEGQAGPDPGETPEHGVLAGPNPEPRHEDQAGSDPGQSRVAQAGPDPDPMHDDFIVAVYPRVHESMKPTTKEQVLAENPPSSTGTLSSMKNLDDTFTFASSSAPHLSTLVIDISSPKPTSSPVQEPIIATTTTTTTTTLPPPPPPPQQGTTNPKLAKRVANHDLYSKIDKYVNDVVKEAIANALQMPLHHTALYNALKVSIDRDNREEFFEETAKSRKRRPQTSSAWKTSDTREATSSSSKQKTASQSEQPIDDIRIPNEAHLSDLEDTGTAHLPKLKTRPDWFKPILEEDRPKTPEPDWVIPSNDLPEVEKNWADALAKTYKDPEENKLLRKTRDMGSFIKWYCRQIGKSKLVKADLEGPGYKLVKPFHKNSISLQFQMEECHLLLTDKIDLVNPECNRVVPDVSKPLPLEGPQGQVTIQPNYFFNKDLEYLVSGDKERGNALSVSKLKATYYPNFGLEELVPSLWNESERDYDISAAYGISHWWFKRKEFYITRHSALSDRDAIRSHMRILSVVSLKTYSRYGYTYLREIVLRRDDYKEYKISKADFRNLHPNDFEDMNLVIRQRVEDLQLDIEIYRTKLNLTQPNWDAYEFLFKEDYTIVHKPRAIIYRDRSDQKKMMRKKEVHKFSDGMLTRILEKLDHMVKDYKLFNFNLGMEHRIWIEDDKRRSEEFIQIIKRRLKIRRIFRNLESFVGRRIKDVDYITISSTE
ncbi:hypothetical protein Tco_1371373 [Tanacetum coccineum]